jgi:hypothetical protein
VTEVPIQRMLGVRVHKDDVFMLMIEVAIVLGLLLVSVAMQARAFLHPLLRKLLPRRFGHSGNRVEPSGRPV